MMLNARTVYILWAIAAIGVTFGSALVGLPVFAAQAMILTLTLSQIVAYFASKSQRSFADTFSTAQLTLFHVWRLIPGSAFLYLYYQRGILPREFATFAGIGDITVAVLAPLAAVVARKESGAARVTVIVFQLIGLADLVNVVRIAGKNALANPDSMRPLLHPPLALLPTILVPITLFAHFVVLHRLLQKQPAAASVTA